MVKILSLLTLSLALVLPGLAQDKKDGEKKSLHGYVVDAMCAKGMAKKDNPMEAAAKHTKSCALEEGCAESGFGVFSDGHYYKFDEAGDELALKLIQGSETKKGMMVEVNGMQKGEVFAVAEIKEHKEAGEEKGNEGHDH